MKKHGCLWWLCIGSWWVPITLPIRIPVALIKRARKHAAEPVQDPELKQETHKVAGVSFRQDALRALGTKNPDFDKTKRALIDENRIDETIYEYSFSPKKVELIHEPDNPYSENGNAVKVVVDGQHIGYIKSGSSAHVLKLIEADRIQHVDCFIGGGRSKIVTEDEDDGRRVLETDEIGFHARLTITTKPEK